MPVVVLSGFYLLAMGFTHWIERAHEKASRAVFALMVATTPFWLLIGLYIFGSPLWSLRALAAGLLTATVITPVLLYRRSNLARWGVALQIFTIIGIILTVLL